ncbi:MAG: hypothetical protein UV73_C0003G0069 [Candidatus Gottesmanbacteria bacterium GW2011_GWA2_43_14]|uniref:Uncharacterized protein n=1 Tax=Candidatus Gottesmanbacteria bacterium GW2011_GWA2_43_14 TaxID=1618443 RepID=A0A0G1DKP5_9BACT|nr:MAG: hypothetical protein UV73_C0003G0069 [Candidatus Gottesmanbacteria bacterium GW2011_GWA2_43_14]
MLNALKKTTDHQFIITWVEKVRGRPQKIEDPYASDKTGLRIDFPGKDDEIYLSDAKKGQNIDWNEFFRIFEDQQLAFLYEENPQAEIPINSYRFIKRDEE